MRFGQALLNWMQPISWVANACMTAAFNCVAGEALHCIGTIGTRSLLLPHPVLCHFSESCLVELVNQLANTKQSETFMRPL